MIREAERKLEGTDAALYCRQFSTSVNENRRVQFQFSNINANLTRTHHQFTENFHRDGLIEILHFFLFGFVNHQRIPL